MLKIWIKRAFGFIAFAIGLTLAGWFIYNQIWPTESFKTGFRSIFQLIPAIACLLVGWTWMRYQGRGIEEITPPDLKCAEVEGATRKAQDSLDLFIAKVEPGIDGAFIKFPIATPQGLTEHIWGYVHFYRDGVFNVSLANQPIEEQQDADGRRNVLRADVEDWQIVNSDGTIHGAYSVIALFEYHEGRGVKLSPKMRAQRAQLLGPL